MLVGVPPTTSHPRGPGSTHVTRRFGWDNMFVHPDDEPRTDGGFHGERDTLVGFLRDQRLTLEMKCSGLDATALASRSVAPSSLSLLGLVRHMAGVESYWFRHVMAGQDVQRPYRTAADRDADFNGTVPDPAVVAEAWDTWRYEAAFAETFVSGASGPDLTALGGDEPVELRSVLVHMIEEYARHNGHANPAAGTGRRTRRSVAATGRWVRSGGGGR